MPVVYAPVDTVLGLIGLALYVVAILALSAAITYAVIRISPTRTSKPKPDES
jgi:hypothetical protein